MSTTRARDKLFSVDVRALRAGVSVSCWVNKTCMRYMRAAAHLICQALWHGTYFSVFETCMSDVTVDHIVL
jgi:hypothetical protein